MLKQHLVTFLTSDSCTSCYIRVCIYFDSWRSQRKGSLVSLFDSCYVSEFGAWCFLAPSLLGPSKDKTRSRFSSHSVSLQLCSLFSCRKFVHVQLFIVIKKRTCVGLPQTISRVFFSFQFESIATYIFLDMQEKAKANNKRHMLYRV